TDCPAIKTQSRWSRSCVTQIAPRTHAISKPLALSTRCTDRAARAIGSDVNGASMINSSCMRSTHACGAERSFDFLVIAGILAHYSARKRSFFISCMSTGNAQAALQPASARPDPGLRSGGTQPVLHQGGGGALHHPVCGEPADPVAGRPSQRRLVRTA